MKTITKKYNIYSFDELSEEVQNKVVEHLSDILINDRFDFLENDLLEILKNDYKLEVDKLNYSLSSCQGDGLCFEMKNILDYKVIEKRRLENTNVFEEGLLNALNDDELKMLFDYLNEGYNFSIIHSGCRYCYASSCNIDYEEYYGDDADVMNKLAEKVADIIFTRYLIICEELENVGYSYYDVSRDEVEELIEANEYEFYEDGSIYVG